MAIAGRLGITDRVRWQTYVTDDELDTLYRTARAFVFLSDYEGFGMTPMEAAARAVPSVMLDTVVAREVYGDGAIRVPLSVPEIAEALVTLLTDEGAHARVSAAARDRLALFTWRHTARVVRDALEAAATRRRS
jgi:glycosyltransferase involved in cell wall biosynthesis